MAVINGKYYSDGHAANDLAAMTDERDQLLRDKAELVAALRLAEPHIGRTGNGKPLNAKFDQDRLQLFVMGEVSAALAKHAH